MEGELADELSDRLREGVGADIVDDDGLAGRYGSDQLGVALGGEFEVAVDARVFPG